MQATSQGRRKAICKIQDTHMKHRLWRAKNVMSEWVQDVLGTSQHLVVEKMDPGQNTRLLCCLQPRWWIFGKQNLHPWQHLCPPQIESCVREPKFTDLRYETKLVHEPGVWVRRYLGTEVLAAGFVGLCGREQEVRFFFSCSRVPLLFPDGSLLGTCTISTPRLPVLFWKANLLLFQVTCFSFASHLSDCPDCWCFHLFLITLRRVLSWLFCPLVLQPSLYFLLQLRLLLLLSHSLFASLRVSVGL